MLSGKFPQVSKFHVAQKADVLYPVVSAASILAKVTRDYELEAWPYRNNNDDNDPSFVCTGPLGSGYPNDPVTKRWLRENVKKGMSALPPSLVRFSWETVAALMRAHQLTWQPHPPLTKLIREKIKKSHACLQDAKIGRRRDGLKQTKLAFKSSDHDERKLLTVKKRRRAIPE